MVGRGLPQANSSEHSGGLKIKFLQPLSLEVLLVCSGLLNDAGSVSSNGVPDAFNHECVTVKFFRTDFNFVWALNIMVFG